MKRIVIIEGTVSSLSCHCEEYTAIIRRDKTEIVIDLSPEAADMIGASFREPMRVVVEIGEADIPLGGLKNASTEDLVHALAAVRTSLDECRRENEALAKSNEGLREDFDAMAAKNDELLCNIAVARLAADDYAKCAQELTERLAAMEAYNRANFHVAFDPEKHITKATVCGWLGAELIVLDMCGNRNHAQETRATIARINAHKDSP